ncbi:MAG: hypothetical protein Q7T76_14290 [Ferruginibacter sp.]|nr:hypothetical protein [Ferruginibacter sp.]
MTIWFVVSCIFLLLIFWLIPKTKFLKCSDLSIAEIRFFLSLKVVTGFALAYYFDHSSGQNDYKLYNDNSVEQYEVLLSNPKLFFTDFTNDLNFYGLGGLFQAEDSFWAYLRFNLLYKFMALLNLVTHGDFYFNSAIFSSLVFFGHVAFYRIFRQLYIGNRLPIMIACFCLPSLLVYTACIHKDGVVFLSLGIISYCFFKLVTSGEKIRFKYILGILGGCLAIFLFRNYVFVALVPALIIAILCKQFSKYKLSVSIISYAIFAVLFFAIPFVIPPLNLPAAVVQRKADFALLQGGATNIQMSELHPDVLSFLRNAPEALNHALVRPYLWEFPQPAVILTAIELIAYYILLFLFLAFRRKNEGSLHVFNIFGLALFFSMMLIIGYTIPNIGAIVRYRSIFWILALAPLAGNTDWSRILSLFYRRPGSSN